MPRAVLVDTWGWMALGHRRDARHKEVRRLYQGLRKKRVRVFTTDYVVDELITLLFRRESFAEATRFTEGLLASAQCGDLTIERVTSQRFAEAWRLRQRFKDKPLISFTDLTTMAVMAELGVTEVLTEDDHFLHVGMGFRLIP